MFSTRIFICAMSKHEVATLRDHARFTAKMFDTVIKNLDTDDTKRTDSLSEYDPLLLGSAHAPLRHYNFKPFMLEKLGETIIDVGRCKASELAAERLQVVLRQEAVRDLPGAGAAWVILTACLIDQVDRDDCRRQQKYLF